MYVRLGMFIKFFGELVDWFGLPAKPLSIWIFPTDSRIRMVGRGIDRFFSMSLGVA
jgi:hypothetical protein